MRVVTLPAVGEIWADRFEVRAELGRGGFGAVFRAYDRNLGREIALKVWLGGGDRAYRRATRFAREAEVLSAIDEPHTVRFHEFGRAPSGELFIASELVEGVDLSKFLAAHGPLSAQQAARVALDVLSSLAAAHQNGVVHRDVKPQNILIVAHGDEIEIAKLTDFGIAWHDAAAGSHLTKTGVSPGTPRFMSPEQIVGDPASPASDVFAVGLVLCEALGGRQLTRAAQIGGVQREMDSDVDPIDLSMIPPRMAAVVRGMLAGRTHRYRDATQARNALRKVTGRPDGRTTSVFAGRRNGRASYVAIALIAVATLAVGLVVITMMSDPPPTRVRAPRPAATVPSASVPAGDTVVADVSVEDVADAVSPRRSPGCDGPAPVGDVPSGPSAGYFLPKSYVHGEPRPVVVVAATTLQTGPKVARISEADVHAERAGYIVMHTKHPGVVPWPNVEVERVVRDIEHLGRHACIDPSQVFVIGFGRGGMVADNIACFLPEVAAVASVSHLPPKPGFSCGAPAIPAIHFLGERDGQRPPQGGSIVCGGRLGNVISAQDYESMWRERNGCEGSLAVDDSDTRVRCRTWSCEQPLQHCMHPWGHGFRNNANDYNQSCFGPKPEIDITAEIFAFFEMHRAQEQPPVAADAGDVSSDR